jgi:sigma-B regulation protein RsbU (phosphoserine phosphatase)
VLDLRTHHLTYCNAAHNAPALITADGKCRLLDVDSNLPIGIEDHYRYEEQQIPFPENTALLLYTDGLTEAMYISEEGSRKLFGEERLLHDLEKNKQASAIEIILSSILHIILVMIFCANSHIIVQSKMLYEASACPFV